MNDAPLTATERAYLGRVRRLIVLQTAPGLVVLTALGAAFFVGAAAVLRAPTPDTPAWSAAPMIVVGALFAAFGIWSAWFNLRERAGITRALALGAAERRTGSIEVPELLPALALMKHISPKVLRLKMGTGFVLLPQLAWLPYLETGAIEHRGVAAHRAFYLLESGPLSVERQGAIGILQTRIAGVYVLMAALLLFLGVGFIGADDATPIITSLGVGALTLGVPLAALAIAFVRRNRRFVAALRAQLGASTAPASTR